MIYLLNFNIEVEPINLWILSTNISIYFYHIFLGKRTKAIDKLTHDTSSCRERKQSRKASFQNKEQHQEDTKDPKASVSDFVLLLKNMDRNK